MLQVGRAPLHVAAETGNLESLIMLLNSGAHRAPRDRVSPSTPLMMHVTMCTMAFSFFHAMRAGICPQAGISTKPGGRRLRTYRILLPKRLKGMHTLHGMLQQSASSCSTPNSQQIMSAVLAPVAFTCRAATLLRHCVAVGKCLT